MEIDYSLMKRINQRKAIKDYSSERLALKKEGMNYFFEKMKLLEKRKEEDEKSAILKGACNIFGNKTKEMVQAYLTYSNNPCFETWKDFRSFLVLPNNTAWQVWCLSDSTAPMENDVEKFPDPSIFNQYYEDIAEKEYNQYKNYYLSQAFFYYSEMYKGCMIEDSGKVFILNEDRQEECCQRKMKKYSSYNEAISEAKEKLNKGDYIFIVDKISGIITLEVP